jgi:hypothetical protein
MSPCTDNSQSYEWLLLRPLTAVRLPESAMTQNTTH